MSEPQSSFPIMEAEKTELTTHVEVSGQRYSFLERRLDVVEGKVDQIIDEIIESQKSLKSTIITTGGSIVVGVISLVIVMLMKF